MNLFLSLIIKKLLDGALLKYEHQELKLSHIIFLLSLVVILIQSFSLFLKVSTNPTYTEVLHVGIRRRFRIPTLFGSMIIVFVLLYLLADFFVVSALTFVVGSLVLAFSWLVFDYICKGAIADYYASQGVREQIHEDPLYAAVGSWMVCDVVLVIWSTLVVLSVWNSKMTEVDAAFAMLLIFSYLSYLVLQSVKGGTSTMTSGPVSQFVRHHFRHFNAATLIEAAEAYRNHITSHGQIVLTLAGAMSTAELGLSLAEMIRQGKVHAISCTGANLEEDLFNLVAHDHYRRVPNYRDLTPEAEQILRDENLNRVTDTCIPQEEAMRRLEGALFDEWVKADHASERYFPHEFMYRVLRSEVLSKYYQIDPKDSWLVAAAEKDLPVWVPGWEDSTIGSMYAARCTTGEIKNVFTVRGGVEYMISLADWYTAASRDHSVGFFQIGGGIAGDFTICVVPHLQRDLNRKDVPLWGYFCQISDSTTSYGSYSGAVPNEKITWGKLEVETPKFIIESDASIVAPLLFAYVLGW